MRDFPIFVTASGVASITLSQIPYTKKAYVRIQQSSDPKTDLEACTSFCYGAGAEEIFITGHPICEGYACSNRILLLQTDKKRIADTDACLFPVTEKTWDQWRDIYNQKSVRIPNAAWLSLFDRDQHLKEGDCYFIHREHELLGIGKASGGRIAFIASVQKGAGAQVLSALCHAVTEDVVQVEVAEQNRKAMDFYQRIGFLPVKELARWYIYQK